jgi:hypothetical protein
MADIPAPEKSSKSKAAADTTTSTAGDDLPTGSNRHSNIDSSDTSTARDWFKMVLKAQHASIIQSQEDHLADRKAIQANADRITRLEELLLAMNVKAEGASHPERLISGRVDLQKFRTSDGPTYKGPFQVTEPFLQWIHGVQIFFETKDVTISADKIRILGNLIAETNIQSFYANEAAGYLTKTWAEFKIRLFEFALPTNWRSDLRKQIRQLEMLPAETFLQYSTRARTLQSLFKFDTAIASRLGDLDLAQFLVYGLPDELQHRVNELQILETVPFVYGTFEKRTQASYTTLRRPIPATVQPRSTTAAPITQSREELLWRIHAYLDSQGRCHFCKKTCGSVSGACPGPLDRSFIEIPAEFTTPPKPLNYVPPRAWGKPQTTPGKPTQPPAGRPPAARAASVSALTEVNYFPELDTAAVSALAALDEELRLTREEADDKQEFPDHDPSTAAAAQEIVAALHEIHHQEGEGSSSGWNNDIANLVAGI